MSQVLNERNSCFFLNLLKDYGTRLNNLRAAGQTAEIKITLNWAGGSWGVESGSEEGGTRVDGVG